jgi:hypothetical protein
LAAVPLDERQLGAATALVAGYDGQTGDALKSRADLARMDSAVRTGLIGPDSEPGRLWNKATSSPEALAPAEAAQLLAHVGSLAESTKDIQHPELKLPEGADVVALTHADGGFAVDVRVDGPAAATVAPAVATAPPVDKPPAPTEPTVRVLPGGGTAVFAVPALAAAVALRHLYPADGNRWIDRQPKAVPSLNRVVLDVSNGESFDNNLMAAPHPATRPGTSVLLEVPPERQALYKQWASASNAVGSETGPAIVREATQQRTVNKVVLSTVADVGKTVHELETLVGAKKVTVYAPKQPDGFVPVTEHVSTDGTRTVVVRSAGTDIETPHAYIAFVRPAEAEGLKPPVPSTGWQPSQDGGSAVMANTAKIAYGHLQDKVTPSPTSLTDIMIGRSKASHFAIGTDSSGVPVVSVGRSAEEAAAGLPMPDAQARASHGVVEVQSSNPDDQAPALRAVALLKALGVDTTSVRLR